jgi:hypothetical protein
MNNLEYNAKVLAQNRVSLNMTFGHEIVPSASSIGKGSGKDFGTILED